MSIGHQPHDLDKALALTERDLKRTAKAIGDLMALKLKANKNKDQNLPAGHTKFRITHYK